MMPKHHSHELPEKWAKRLSLLHPCAEILLQLSAVAKVSLSKTALQKAAKICVDETVDNALLRDVMECLIDEGWFSHESSRFCLPLSLRRPLVQQAMLSDRMEEFFCALDVVAPRLYRDTYRAWQYSREWEYALRRSLWLDLRRFKEDGEANESLLEYYGKSMLEDMVLFETPNIWEHFDKKHWLEGFRVILKSEERHDRWVYKSLKLYLDEPFDKKSIDIYEAAFFYVLQEMDWEAHGKLLALFGQYKLQSVTASIHEGFYFLIMGDVATSVEAYERGLRLLRLANPKKKARYEDPIGLCYALALILRQGKGDLEKAEQVLKLPQKLSRLLTVTALKAMLAVLQSRPDEAKEQLEKFSSARSEISGLESVLLLMMAEFWLYGKKKEVTEAIVAELALLDQSQLSKWEKHLMAEMEQLKSGAKTFEPPHLYHPMVQRLDLWESSLTRLENLLQGKGAKSKPAASVESTTRIAYKIQHHQSEHRIVDIQPVLQTSKKSGWTSGRNVALKRYKEGGLPECALDQDLACAKGIRSYTVRRGYWGSSEEYEVNIDKMVPLLIDHPHLVDAFSDQPLQLQEGQLSLDLKEVDGGWRFEVYPKFSASWSSMVTRESGNVLMVYRPAPEQKQVLQVLEADVVYPKDVAERLQGVTKQLSQKFVIHGAGVEQDDDVEEVQSDVRVYLSLQSRSEELFIHPKACPLGPNAGGFIPGEGPHRIMAEVEGRKVQTERSFSKERESLRICCDHLGWDPESFMTEGAHIVEPIACLQVLDRLRDLEEHVALVWPEGQAKKIRMSLEQSDLKLKFSKGRDWLEVKGEVEGLDLELLELLKLIKQRQGNFLVLDDGDILKLSDGLIKDLQALEMAESEDEDLQLHPLLAVQLQHLEGASAGRPSKDWNLWKKRYEESLNLEVKIPANFEGHLRSYQWEGVQWMMRMAHWGAGVCLADDMGLGKTVQTLAVLLDRSSEGPSLVVAPTSLMRNWQDESMRFASGLRVLIYGEGGPKVRKETLATLGKGDLLLCTYGLLQRDHELICEHSASKPFACLVLDEAQAIKNPRTKRRKAVAKIKAGFKIGLSGTPLENDIQELWSLFDVLNPGLLGPLKRFEDKFDCSDDDMRGQVLQGLRTVIQPFILRRLKRDVLKELPAKTEVVLDVELSSKERTLYETLRQSAKEMVESAKGPQRRLAIFAELMKLRRACCHPRLIAEEMDFPSSKLELFVELVQNLKSGGHRALVFSQFVEHLKFIREACIEMGLSYQYLDGSTRAKARAEAVESFQAGQGDLFLISLKAGGTGLNLTAADYVIHMDPWWNPAVEDQASDRAHRIGQTRPVTVYRLVAKDTIEERIIELHHHKRDLADSVLSGQAQTKKANLDELVDILL